MVARTRVVVNGTLGASNQERFSLGLNFTALEAVGQAGASNMANNIAAAMVSFGAVALGNLGTLLSTRGSIRTVDVYGYGPTGGAVSSASATLSSPLTGTGTATSPPQCAAVISLLTGQPGASRRGRVYWPALNPTVDGELQSNVARSCGPQFLALVDTIEEQVAAIQVGVWGVYSPTLDVVTPVSAVRTGNVIDTQRRRRDSLPETYTTTNR